MSLRHSSQAGILLRLKLCKPVRILHRYLTSPSPCKTTKERRRRKEESTYAIAKQTEITLALVYNRPKSPLILRLQRQRQLPDSSQINRASSKIQHLITETCTSFGVIHFNFNFFFLQIVKLWTRTGMTFISYFLINVFGESGYKLNWRQRLMSHYTRRWTEVFEKHSARALQCHWCLR